MAYTATALEGGQKTRKKGTLNKREATGLGPVNPVYIGHPIQDTSQTQTQEPDIKNEVQQNYGYTPTPTPTPAPAPTPVEQTVQDQIDGGFKRNKLPTPTLTTAGGQQGTGTEPVGSAKLYEDYLALLGEMPTYNYGDFEYTPYKSAYDELIQNAVKKLTDWNYDPEKDTSYQAYKTQYTNAGQTAQEDALARLAARTGGIANSYAVSAAQQQYNNYMQELAGKIPELEQLAYQKAQNELNNYRELDNDDYQKYLNDRNLDYNTWVQGAANAWNSYQADANGFGNRLNYYLNRIQSEEGKEAEERNYTRQKETEEREYGRQLETEERQYNRQLEAAEKEYQRQIALKQLASQLAMQEQAAKYGYEMQLAAAKAAGNNAGSGSSGTTSTTSLSDIYKDSNGNVMEFLNKASNAGYSAGNLYSVAEEMYYSKDNKNKSIVSDDDWKAIQEMYGINDWTSEQKKKQAK